jgi:hypothetical protein
MNVKMIQGMVGDNYSYLPRQVIKVPDELGEKLIRNRVAVKAGQGSDVDAEHPSRTDEERAESLERARAKYRRMGLDPERVFAKRRGIERAVTPPARTPEGDKEAAEACEGQTGAGNPCKKRPLPGKRFCDKHGG